MSSDKQRLPFPDVSRLTYGALMCETVALNGRLVIAATYPERAATFENRVGAEPSTFKPTRIFTSLLNRKPGMDGPR